jgi:hypothetical protein
MSISKKPKEIRLYNMPCWIGKTLWHSIWWNYKYRKSHRSISLKRIIALFRPNLRRPVFIVGAARSGTTFLGHCIGSLPEISYHHEPVLTKAAARYVFEKRWTTSQAAFFYRMVYGLLMRLYLDADLRFAEKTPRNCNIMTFLSSAFPDSQFIHIIRDGRDAALSLSKQPWLSMKEAASNQYEPGGYPFGPYAHFWVETERVKEFETTSDIHRCIWAWRIFTEKALEYGARLPESRYHELRYETLINNPVSEGERLLDFLHIHNPESIALFKKEVTKARQNAIGRWKTKLSEEDLQYINAEAGELLRRLMYIS